MSACSASSTTSTATCRRSKRCWPTRTPSAIERWLLGGDYGIVSPWPLETLERLDALPNATWIRGNGERWAREPPSDRVEEIYRDHASSVPDDVIERLYRLPTQAELDGILYVHGSPISTRRASRRSRATTTRASSAASATGRSSSATATSSSADRARTGRPS